MKRSIPFILALLFSAFSAYGKATWEEQQARAEEISAEYQAKYPKLSSEKIVFKTVPLPEGGSLDLDFRIVRPKQGGPFPVVFYIHGGAWGTGTKAQFTHESYVLADQGIAGVRLEYRWKSHGAKYPEAMSDVLDAIDYVRQHAAELNIDFTRVGLAGGSAGGHLSAIAAQLTPECICYDGFNGLFDAFERNGGNFGGGDYTGTTEAEKKKASAMYNLKKNPPDTFLYHGTHDTTVVVKQAYRFAEAIRNKGGKAEVLAYEGAGHAFFNKDPYQTATTQAMLAHTSYVFGLTDKKPNLANYELPALKGAAKSVDSMPEEQGGLIGAWNREEISGKVFVFKNDHTAVNPSGEELKWEEREGRFYIIWKNGNPAPISFLDEDRIKVGKMTFTRGSGAKQKVKTMAAPVAAQTAAVSSVSASPASNATPSAPNILFIHMEDMGCEIPAYGDNTQKTPALSKLAQEGMVFERVNVTAPSCAPSRGSLFTGLYPHQNGMWAFDKTHGFHYRDGVPTFVRMFKEAGFATGISYKTGVNPQDRVPFDYKYTYNKNALGKDPGKFQVSNCIDGFEHFLQNLPQGKRFYFQAQTNDTHVDWSPSFEPIRGEKSKLGFNPVDPNSVKPLPHWGKLELDTKSREWLATYYGAIQRVDYFVAKVLALLEQYGHAENTIVIFSSDHGPSDLHRGKTTSYEFGLRVPFIVKWPGIVKPKTRSEALVSFVDLMPTFLDLTELPKPNYLPGKSIVPILTGERPEGDRKLLYSAYNTHTTGMDNFWPARTVNDGRYKLIYNLLGDGKHTRPGKNGSNFSLIPMMEASEEGRRLIERTNTPPSFELFDLKRDPGELVNLAGNPEYAQIEKQLKSELESWRKDVVADPLADPATLKEFVDEYEAHCLIWAAKVEEMGGSKVMQREGWALDKSRWIPAWDPSPYRAEP